MNNTKVKCECGHQEYDWDTDQRTIGDAKFAAELFRKTQSAQQNAYEAEEALHDYIRTHKFDWSEYLMLTDTK